MIHRFLDSTALMQKQQNLTKLYISRIEPDNLPEPGVRVKRKSRPKQELWDRYLGDLKPLPMEYRQWSSALGLDSRRKRIRESKQVINATRALKNAEVSIR